MKKRYSILLICISCISISTLVHAQFTCLDYNAYLEKKSALDSSYDFAKDIFDSNWRSRKLGMRSYSQMSVDERKLINEHTRFSKLVDQQLRKSGLLFNKIDRVEFQLYFNNEGTINFAACRFQNSELTRIQNQSIQDSLCAWLSGYKSSLSGKGSFRTYASWSIKDIAEAGRIISGISTTKKAERGVIRTLDELNTTRPDTVVSVNLEKLDLREVPQSLQKFKNLKTLID
jgi:hypothetical protein